MKKHFKKLLDFLLFGVPLFIQVLFKMENKNQFPFVKGTKLTKACIRCGTDTYHPTEICALCRILEIEQDKHDKTNKGGKDYHEEQ